MIDKELYSRIEKNYGHCSSWAVWADENNTPTSNVGDLSIFNVEENPSLLDILNPNIVMVGLNISRKLQAPFNNFHDTRSIAKDYKIRFAFKNTKYWGAYMTDIIKDFEQKISGQVVSYLNVNKEFEKKNAELFRQELKDIKANNPKIIAFGKQTYDILKRNFQDEFNIVRVLHYSYYISQEKYRQKVLAEISESNSKEKISTLNAYHQKRNKEELKEVEEMSKRPYSSEEMRSQIQQNLSE